MTLIIETGEGVSGANSYISTADAQAYMDARSLSVTLTDGLLLRAMDALPSRFRGVKTSSANPLPWPRMWAYDAEGELIPSDVIPTELIEAQAWLAYYIDAGNDPAAVATPAITSETIDVLSVTYAVNNGATTAVSLLSLPNVRNRLRHLINVSGGIDRA